jgi:hypothetical protein
MRQVDRKTAEGGRAGGAAARLDSIPFVLGKTSRMDRSWKAFTSLVHRREVSTNKKNMNLITGGCI